MIEPYPEMVNDSYRGGEALSHVDPSLHGTVEQILSRLDYVDEINEGNFVEAIQTHEEVIRVAREAYETTVHTADEELRQHAQEHSEVADYMRHLRGRLENNAERIVNNTIERQTKHGQRNSTRAELAMAQAEFIKVDDELREIGGRLNANKAATDGKRASAEKDSDEFRLISDSLRNINAEQSTSAQALVCRLEDRQVAYHDELHALAAERESLATQSIDTNMRRAAVETRISELEKLLRDIDVAIARLDDENSELRAEVKRIEEAADSITITHSEENDTEGTPTIALPAQIVIETGRVEATDIAGPASVPRGPLLTKLIGQVRGTRELVLTNPREITS